MSDIIPGLSYPVDWSVTDKSPPVRCYFENDDHGKIYSLGSRTIYMFRRQIRRREAQTLEGFTKEFFPSFLFFFFLFLFFCFCFSSFTRKRRMQRASDSHLPRSAVIKTKSWLLYLKLTLALTADGRIFCKHSQILKQQTALRLDY